MLRENFGVVQRVLSSVDYRDHFAVINTLILCLPRQRFSKFLEAPVRNIDVAVKKHKLFTLLILV